MTNWNLYLDITCTCATKKYDMIYGWGKWGGAFTIWEDNVMWQKWVLTNHAMYHVCSDMSIKVFVDLKQKLCRFVSQRSSVGTKTTLHIIFEFLVKKQWVAGSISFSWKISQKCHMYRSILFLLKLNLLAILPKRLEQAWYSLPN